ncbi:hypothetical protein, partial [Alienimonas chondri]|uniref:hypothetical protein n=1 Tax=Alienimonas chondri TaxID=2681879 RepID=UPI0019D61741
MSDVPPIRTVESPEEGEPRSWWVTALAALGLGTAEGTGGMGVSLAVHGVVLLAMALWAVDAQIDGGGLTLSLTPGADDTAELELIDTQFEESGGSPLVMTAPPMELMQEDAPGVPVELLTTAAGGTDEGAGTG